MEEVGDGVQDMVPKTCILIGCLFLTQNFYKNTIGLRWAPLFLSRHSKKATFLNCDLWRPISEARSPNVLP